MIVNLQPTKLFNSKFILICPLHFNYTNVVYVVGPSVNPLQIKETQHVNIVLQCMYQFFEQSNMKGNHA
jgi:hypothetical protein